MILFAYLDAGTGSLIIQAIIGAGVAIAVIVRTYWHKIRRVFIKSTKVKSEDLRTEEN